jgi:hypothetical protein
MNLWQLIPDPSREPHPLILGERVKLRIGTWPIEPGQRVWMIYRVNDGADLRCDAVWDRNEGANSYWSCELGPFSRSTRVSYTLHRHPRGPWRAAPNSCGSRFIFGPADLMVEGRVPRIPATMLGLLDQVMGRIRLGFGGR